MTKFKQACQALSRSYEGGGANRGWARAALEAGRSADGDQRVGETAGGAGGYSGHRGPGTPSTAGKTANSPVQPEGRRPAWAFQAACTLQGDAPARERLRALN